MIAAERPDRRSTKLLSIDASGNTRELARRELASLFGPSDLVVANDAATLPASLRGTHLASGERVEFRLAGWVSLADPSRFFALAFGAGDHRTPTEDRAAPPRLSAGDCLALGPLAACIECLVGHPRLVTLRFLGSPEAILHGMAHHGRPIQYAHVPEPLALWDVWTPIAGEPVAFEPPSAGFVLDWGTLAVWRRRGIRFATLTHAAGISSTGDPALDMRLPFDEPYRIPEITALAVNQRKLEGGRIIAIGTTVVRALESAVGNDGKVRAGHGVAVGRIGRETRLRIVDAILTGVHRAGDSHFELLEAFMESAALRDVAGLAVERGYRTHEFGDFMLIEHKASSPPPAAS